MRELSRRSFLQFAPLAVTAASCGKADQRVLVFHAGSLSQLVEEIARRFEESHPTVRIDSESSGSLDAIRKVTDLGRACDLLLTAVHRAGPGLPISRTGWERDGAGWSAQRDLGRKGVAR